MQTIRIKINQNILTVNLADNSSAEALRDLVATKGPISVKLQDYGGFEKVGDLGYELPRNDKLIKTEPGDFILYQGSQITIYYSTNFWSLTRLGKISDISESQLRKVLGQGDVVATLFL